VHQEEIKAGKIIGNTYQFDLSGLAPGVYAAVLKSDDILKESKLVIR
jgi:hypothetical protein